MNLEDTKLPYELFKLIRVFVGEKDLEIKSELCSFVSPKADKIFRNMYAIPDNDVYNDREWIISGFNKGFLEEQYNRQIIAVGQFVYVRTIPRFCELSYRFKRETIRFTSPSKIWRVHEFLQYICDCESDLRWSYNAQLGHIFADGLDVVRIGDISHIFPYLH